MGILNVTPDSFSDGGKYYEIDSAVEHAVEMITSGADIIDIGGESTRPGSDSVPEREEINRVVPVIEKILKIFPNTIISIDTTKKNVAYEALKRGARIINDISGLTFEPEMAELIRDFNAALVIMHLKGIPKNMQQNPSYADVVNEVFDFLYKQTEIAKNAGVADIIVDPGIGFGKSIFHNYEVLKHLEKFKALGYPVLIGLSRKSFLGKSLGLDIDKREMATVIAETLALRNGADIIRTHNVKNAVQSRQIFMNFTNPELVRNNV